MSNTPQSSTGNAIAALWHRNHPQILARLDLLDRAASAFDAQGLSDSLRSDAVDVAHKLAGSLGMFGFMEGTRLAREIEHALEQHCDSSSPAALLTLTAQLRACLFPRHEGGSS